MNSPESYKEEIESWRKDSESDLLKPEGWLSVAGLFWLKEGENSIGTKDGSVVLLPTHSGAKFEVGTLTRHDGTITLDVKDGADVQVNGQSGLHFDIHPNSDTIKVGSVWFRVIIRGQRIGVRLYDHNAQSVKSFKGQHWYAVKPEYRLKAKFVAYNPPKTFQIINVLGDSSPSKVPGYVEFSIKGKTYRLDAQEGGQTLFFNFKDSTSGKETYGAGRFLDTPLPVNGEVDLDFNKAVNPPCAFTAFATCPLPPKSNFLAIPIPAGELAHHPEH